MKTKIEVKLQLLLKVKKRLTSYLMAFQKAGKWKCLLTKIPTVLILPCLEINSVLNGWSGLTQNTKGGYDKVLPLNDVDLHCDYLFNRDQSIRTNLQSWLNESVRVKQIQFNTLILRMTH